MSNPKSPEGLEKHITGDGSPTLSIEGGEKMHSLEGAMAESLYIYQPCIEATLPGGQPRVLSMGLGLGYNELIASGLFLAKGMKDFKICSFESHPLLRQFFQDWLQDQNTPLSDLYNDILQRVSQHFDVTTVSLKTFLQDATTKRDFLLQKSLPNQNPWPWRFNGILYDAFSGETDSYLWTEQHLRNFLQEYCDPESCYFTTYAATGNLKRSLKAEHFVLEKKGGFGKKRESTYAYRS